MPLGFKMEGVESFHLKGSKGIRKILISISNLGKSLKKKRTNFKNKIMELEETNATCSTKFFCKLLNHFEVFNTFQRSAPSDHNTSITEIWTF